MQNIQDNQNTHEKEDRVGELTQPHLETYHGGVVIETVVQDRQTENGTEEGSELDLRSHVNIWSLTKAKAIQWRKDLQSLLSLLLLVDCTFSFPFLSFFSLGQPGQGFISFIDVFKEPAFGVIIFPYCFSISSIVVIFTIAFLLLTWL